MSDRVTINLEARSCFIDKLVVEVSHIIGYFSLSAVFPILSFNQLNKNHEELTIEIREAKQLHIFREKNQIIIEFIPTDEGIQTCCWYLANHFKQLIGSPPSFSVSDDHLSSTKYAPDDQTFQRQKELGLSTIFDIGTVLLDQNHDFLPDFIDAEILMDQTWTDSQLIAASNLAVRLGLEVTALNYPLVSEKPKKSYHFSFNRSNQVKFYQEKNQFIFAGNGSDLVDLSTFVCESFPEMENGLDWAQLLEKIASSLAMKNLDGELTWLENALENPHFVKEVWLSPNYYSKIKKIREKHPDIQFKGFKEQQQVYRKTYEQVWEVDVLKQLLSEQFFTRIKPKDQIELLGAISEDQSQLAIIRKWVEEQVKNKQADLNHTLISSYKTGFSWIVEALLPKLKQFTKIESVTIYFRPFLSEGETEWLDEDGSTPSYSLIREGNQNVWLDLPIRFLQELYPVDDIIADQLALSRDQIFFRALEETGSHTYRVVAKNVAGNVILNETFEVLTTEQAYLEEYPEQGLVHPNTSFITGNINGKCVLQERISSDLETVWSIFQNEILPDVRAYCLNKLSGKVAVKEQPLFSQLKIEVFISEPDEKLSSRQDLYSSLDALQEDLYFVGLDYFRLFGQEHGGIPLDAPGLILPIIHKTVGAPKVEVTLFEPVGKQACIFTSEQPILPLNKEPKLRLSCLEIVKGEKIAIIAVEAQESLAEILRCYGRMLEKGNISITNDFQGIDKITFILNNQHQFSVVLPKKVEVAKKLSISDVNFYENQLIGYEQYVQIIRQLQQLPELKVYPIAETYQGREIYGIELKPQEEGYVSRVKRINQFPSEIINARHHANEVSGTNGVFLLLRELLQNPKYRNVSQKINLTLIPFENADGAALHYELQKEHPEWKFHVARFNSLGKDFYYEYFKKETIHTEALGFSKLWEKWLPDIIVDNHGVPSHEWEQPFSGYTSPAFKGFWLPRSLLYGYFWLIEDDRFKGNLLLNQQIESLIADKMNQQQDMYKWNQEWQNRFEKYAHQWLPKLFSAEYYKNMINYTISFAYDKEHRYPSIRFPWITTVCYTSEVTDETATGKLLELCSQVHLMHELTVIDELMTADCYFKDEKNENEASFRIDGTRQRPIVFTNKKEVTHEKNTN